MKTLQKQRTKTNFPRKYININFKFTTLYSDNTYIALYNPINEIFILIDCNRDVTVYTNSYKYKQNLNMRMSMQACQRQKRYKNWRSSWSVRIVVFELGGGHDFIMGIQIYLKYKYTYENTGFAILCVDAWLQNIKIFEQSKFSMIFTEYVTGASPPPPTHERPYDVFRGQNRHVTLPSRDIAKLVSS